MLTCDEAASSVITKLPSPSTGDDGVTSDLQRNSLPLLRATATLPKLVKLQMARTGEDFGASGSRQ